MFHQYATYTAQQLPFIWTAELTYTVRAVNSKLANVRASTRSYTLLPEYWYFTK